MEEKVKKRVGFGGQGKLREYSHWLYLVEWWFSVP